MLVGCIKDRAGAASGMITEIAAYFSFEDEDATTDGFHRIYALDPTPNNSPAKIKLEHHTHATLMQKVRALMPRGKLGDIWQTFRGVPIFFTDPKTYASIEERQPLVALFMLEDAPGPSLATP